MFCFWFFRHAEGPQANDFMSLTSPYFDIYPVPVRYLRQRDGPFPKLGFQGLALGGSRTEPWPYTNGIEP
jgi:hypothetical protein